MDKLVLKDGTVIEINEGAALGYIETVCKDAAAMADVVAVITPDNVSEVEFTHNDEVTGEYKAIVLDTGNYTVNEDGTILLVISLREKTDIELRVDALEAGQTTQDGAIEDLGAAVSDIAEGV